MDELLARETGGAASGLSGRTIVRRTPPTPSVVFDTYWRFAQRRQEVYLKRVRGTEAPWTDDPILEQFKFTNTYRAADRVSQFLIRQVIYARGVSWQDRVLRVLLFKIFNKIETWQLLEEALGQVKVDTFDIRAFSHVLQQARTAGASIYSAAYIMPSGPAEIRRSSKHLMHLELLASQIEAGLSDTVRCARSFEHLYLTLLALPGIGPFLAYQFATDLNYCDELDFDEMDFVVPGPGARDGIRKCFTSLGDYNEADTIRWVTERQDTEFARLDIRFSSLWGRPLQLIDCQNVFCEVDKYSRVAHPEVLGISGRSKIKQKFSQSGAALPRPWFPPKWRINEAVEKDLKLAPHAST